MLEPTKSEPEPAEASSFDGDLGVSVGRPTPAAAVLSVQGEVDSLTTPQLDAGIADLLAVPDTTCFVIDLSEVTFLASGGLATLIQAAQLVGERGHRLRLVVTTRAVRRPLQLTGSDQLFDMFEDLDAATSGPV